MGRAREDAVRRGDVDLAGAVLVERVDRVDHRAGGVDHVVDHDGDLAVDVADEVHGLGDVVRRAHLGEHGEIGVEPVGEALGELHAARVGRDGDQLGVAEAAVAKVVGQDGHGRHVVDGDLEEALHLALMEVHRQDAVGAGGFEQRGHEAGGDRFAGGALFVLAGVGEVRQHGGDAVGRGQLGRLDHDEQLDDVLVQLAVRRLHEEHVGVADAFFVARVDLAVGERREQHRAQRDAQLVGDGLAELRIAAAREQHEPALRRARRDTSSWSRGSFRCETSVRPWIVSEVTASALP